jgi:hypothetical protein
VPKEVAQREPLFAKSDKNGDGELSREEFLGNFSGISGRSVRRVFRPLTRTRTAS